MIGGITEAGIKQAEANKAEFHAKKRREAYLDSTWVSSTIYCSSQ